MTEHVNQWNQSVVNEFRASDGKLGGDFAGAPVLLLHTTGARSGKEWVTPMMYQELGDGRMAVFASKAGAPTDPDWYHNVVAHPEVTAEIGTERRPVHARTADPAEREPIWTKQKHDFPGFADYESKTSRIIPVVILEPR